MNADKEHREPGPAGSGFLYSPIVVGVTPGQDPAVLARAAELAQELSAPLICAYVDPASYLIEWNREEPIVPTSLEPVPEPDDEAAINSRQLRTGLAHILDPLGITWTLRVLAGDTALALGRLGASSGASMIIVGSRRVGLLARMEELVNGSVALRLLSTQQLPVLGVPLQTTSLRMRMR
ncbi:universal stress protein [Pseudarthrobacter sp. S9]|uniref:universal stress protein n=1 Tax=Pseudarthrobacter sp. S9 TaxID=3418421 RepID=UPI003CFCC41D